jgi:pyridoxal phosphate enzyme (YggS family)
MSADGATPAPTVDAVRQRAEVVRDRIRSAGGDPDEVVLVAVTKAFGPGVMRVALDAGLADVGENYAQELVDKAAALGPDVLAAGSARVHFVGRLQRNKVRSIAALVDLWQTVDRVELGTEIARRSPGASVLVQVNASREPQKGGCDLQEAPMLVDQLGSEGLDVAGLMAVGVADDDDATRRAFAAVTSMADDLDLPVRSMGMSADLEIAVQEGATMVRIGRDLFGRRPLPPARMPGEQEKRVQ